jgi:hypothetical protein
LKSVNVDSVGIGYYMAQHLRDCGFSVNEVNVGEAARDTDKYSNLKAELYRLFREHAMSGDLAGLTDERAIAQLAGIRYAHNSRGQIVIESKAEARKRGVKSVRNGAAINAGFSSLKNQGAVGTSRKEYVDDIDSERRSRHYGGHDVSPAGTGRHL